MLLEVGQPEPGGGDDVVERAHEVRLGDDREVAQRGGGETGVQAAVERGAGVGVVPQRLQSAPVVGRQPLVVPAVPGTPRGSQSQGACKQRAVHDLRVTPAGAVEIPVGPFLRADSTGIPRCLALRLAEVPGAFFIIS
ncbi:hypothetical protein GCM10022262_30160 [Georgenia daeguensis]|uniref:Uncharacterized protein n=1 Tax=Georgenia daeguensis TaxID=908355 RepID=A0ABP8EXC9_9MICO